MLKRLLLAGGFVVGTTVAAAAADLPSPPPIAPAPPPPMASPAFDWSGPYIGVYGNVLTNFSAIGLGAGVQAGFNIQRGSFVAGLELQAGAAYDFGAGAFAVTADANAKLGFALGQRALLYGEAGIGAFYLFGGGFFPYWTAGGGLEFAIRDPMTVYLEAKVLQQLSVATPLIYVFEAGLNWHR
jgi:opacity protein-like surface antigen